MSTQKTPSHRPSKECYSLRTQEKWQKRGDLKGEIDLFGIIKGFLETRGIKVYRIEVEPETYQVEHYGQIIRFYVQRKEVRETRKSSPQGDEE